MTGKSKAVCWSLYNSHVLRLSPSFLFLKSFNYSENHIQDLRLKTKFKTVFFFSGVYPNLIYHSKLLQGLLRSLPMVVSSKAPSAPGASPGASPDASAGAMVETPSGFKYKMCMYIYNIYQYMYMYIYIIYNIYIYTYLYIYIVHIIIYIMIIDSHVYGTCINIYLYIHPIAFLDNCLNSHIGSSVYIDRSSCVCINICIYTHMFWLYFGSWINSTVFFLQVLAFSEGLNATTIYNGTCSSYLVPKSWIMFEPLNLGKWPTSSLSSTPTCPAPFGIQGPSGPTVPAWDASGASGASGPAAAAATSAASQHDWIYEDGLVKVKGMGHWQYMGLSENMVYSQL